MRRISKDITKHYQWRVALVSYTPLICMSFISSSPLYRSQIRHTAEQRISVTAFQTVPLLRSEPVLLPAVADKADATSGLAAKYGSM